MKKTKLFVSLLIFTLLMIFTSAIKNQTRIIEKKITKLEKQILILSSNFYESQLDFFYLSSPSYVSKKIDELTEKNTFKPMAYSKIYLSYENYKGELIKSVEFINEKKIDKK
jgi:hypothetical protein|tara:strand:+ start:495 stop:830 length:336 start_codon:yes stop_codon:yes gene_type:complete